MPLPRTAMKGSERPSRRWRWVVAAIIAVTIVALLRVGLAVMYSNWPYRDEIAADLSAYALSQEAYRRRAEEALASADSLPALFQVERLANAFGMVTQFGDAAGETRRCLEFYDQLEASLWTAAERAVLPTLREADDPAAQLHAMLIDTTATLAETGRAEQALYFDSVSLAPSYRLFRLPLRGYKAAAMANARSGDSQAAVEMSLDLLEALGSVPRPWSMEFVSWLPSHLCDIENTLIAAAARAPLGPDQIDRHTAAWESLRAYDGLYEAVRVGATQWIEQSRGLPLWRRVEYEFNVYAYGRRFEAISTGAAGPPFDLFGYATGVRYLAGNATSCKARLDIAHGAKATLDALCALRRYEVDRGALPGSMTEWTDGAGFQNAALRFVDGVWRAELSIIQGGSVDLAVQPAGAPAD